MNLKRQSSAQVISDSHLDELIIEAIRDIKGKRITKLDLGEIEDTPADYYIVCEGESSTQVKAIADNISKKVWEDSGLKPSHVEGTVAARWILIDYFSTIVHVFHPETRAFYQIEDLWSDAKVTYYENL